MNLGDESNSRHPDFPEFEEENSNLKDIMEMFLNALPLELEHGLLLEKEGDHGNILLVCVIGVIDARGE